MPAADTGHLLLHCHPLGYGVQQTYKPWNHMGFRAIKYCFYQKPCENTTAFQHLQSQPPHQRRFISRFISSTSSRYSQEKLETTNFF